MTLTTKITARVRADYVGELDQGQKIANLLL